MGWRFTTPSRRGYQISNPLRSANKKAAFETSRRLTAFLLWAAKPDQRRFRADTGRVLDLEAHVKKSPEGFHQRG